ncbi:amino acid ABC transporter permease [Rhizobium leguminosarum]|nr:amino acid ABC transporter permease [Rhizobium leguminosarum]MBY5419996.1 amino acid ABC transporter permease [Rhizobium leguminosarum]MBY5793951.1 amino acid ABC transporter permease [Rhizobium leguminosarum]MBY5839172.1 amino acid ABC transporter permease [Rhizobium leguminosarum]MBY5869717.1 amino acid ABC transporter permease [Rhizobium leguminosarum]MBY5918400.1 amino acid ABC transporter permease [Rhizobium leguminosarum]
MNSWYAVLNHLPAMLYGLRFTFLIAIVSLTLSMVFGGLVVSLLRSKSATIRATGFLYIQIFRSLSPYVYVLLVYFALAGATGWKMDPVTAAIISLTLLNSAYVAEIYRSVLLTIDGGQWEAAAAMGLSHWKTNSIVIWPQALRTAIPLLLNQFIVILKDSAIVGVIGVKDIVYVANAQASITYKQFEYLTVVGVIFILIVFILSRLSLSLERRLAWKL